MTDTDRKNIRFLQTIPQDESWFTILPLVGATGVAGWLAWRRAVKKIAAA